MTDNDSLSFEGEVFGRPGHADPILRDDPEVLVYAKRRKTTESVWTIRGYTVLGDGVVFEVADTDRAGLAAVLVEVFEPDALTVDDRHRSQTPIRDGVPTVVALDGKPAIAAWLYVRGSGREAIAETLGVGQRTVREYLSRFRRRGVGLGEVDQAPDVGAEMAEIPPAFDHAHQEGPA